MLLRTKKTKCFPRCTSRLSHLQDTWECCFSTLRGCEETAVRLGSKTENKILGTEKTESDMKVLSPHKVSEVFVGTVIFGLVLWVIDCGGIEPIRHGQGVPHWDMSGPYADGLLHVSWHVWVLFQFLGFHSDWILGIDRILSTHHFHCAGIIMICQSIKN